ncbi:AmmeMemoRadiSam system protein A [Varunaivibrio sulfuroxidans]|uniref:Uncharacterized protein (TIGR00296 family)/AmmeMemoRadiSam system protein A n=1 Tax=Varunaivibrio sulfuroxidans TaxID=1773489 RepID=A0A4R3J6C2_9PROT|nr:AmmeMemoRadiSam system protein A [Varunaivibrio sulfuroxidans]TCS60386.1 uncharacterized protein (TIGR00296 family)/AmmeMemoRadiSam system protein A [Varunaivibrio sulfuroxidans]WES30927.1 AmmeMemoRadiSam system protein A [Varunaivibrio sulfuroxidans]
MTTTTDTEQDRDMARIAQEYGDTLIALAARAIAYGLDHGVAMAVDPTAYPPLLAEPGAVFVTLKKKGQLRGCIGSSTAFRPLVQDIADNAFSAAFRDTRFLPMTRAEMADMEISLSLLSPSREMTFHGERDLLTQLRPQIDGLIIDDGVHRALFLPQVWEQLPTPNLFLSHLKAKAGMSEDDLPPDTRAWRFSAHGISGNTSIADRE